MAFQSNKPQATDKLSVSQVDLLNNFTSLGTVFNGVDTLACLFPALGASPAAAVNTIGLYNKSNNLVWRKDAGSGGTEIILTDGALNNPGYTMLPSGLLIKWAQNVSCVAGANTINANAAPFTGPNFVAIIGVFITVSTNGAASADREVQLVSIAPTQFNVYASQRTTTAAAAAFASIMVIGTR